MKQILFAISTVWLFVFISALVVGGFMWAGLILGWRAFSLVIAVSIIALFYVSFYVRWQR